MSEGLQTVERRGRPRRRVLSSCVQLKDCNGGTILNISQTGLALQAVAELLQNKGLQKLRFQFSRSQPWIETTARITWRSDSNRIVGVEFIDLPDDASLQIQKWISLTNVASGFDEEAVALEGTDQLAQTMPAREPATAGPLLEAQILDLFFAKDRSQPGTLDAADQVRSATERTPHLVGRSVAVILLLSAFTFLDHQLLQKTGKKNSETTVESKRPVPFPLSPSFDPDPSSASTTNHPAFALQVGAMAHKENAKALMESLRQRNFRVFVYKRGRLYRVVVGPYDGADSLLRAQNELENQGFRTIRSEWKAETSPASPVEISARERTSN